MISWLAANWGNILVILIVTGLLALAVFAMVRDKKKGKSSCGCGCAGCALADKCKGAKGAK